MKEKIQVSTAVGILTLASFGIVGWGWLILAGLILHL
jgi:hypothetical protein